eukprot:11204290-Lingulodinium_polyedra.AAC.1
MIPVPEGTAENEAPWATDAQDMAQGAARGAGDEGPAPCAGAPILTAEPVSRATRRWRRQRTGAHGGAPLGGR